jgi:hypothetical protein
MPAYRFDLKLTFIKPFNLRLNGAHNNGGKEGMNHKANKLLF